MQVTRGPCAHATISTPFSSLLSFFFLKQFSSIPLPVIVDMIPFKALLVVKNATRGATGQELRMRASLVSSKIKC